MTSKLNCINPTPQLFEQLLLIQNMISKFEKKNTSYWYVELVETNPLIYNTLQFDQYSRLTILLKKFRFSVKDLKINSKFDKSFSLVCRAR